MPPKNIVKNIFIKVLPVPFLLPPNGMYKCSFKNLERVICQHFQNSLKDPALYGEKKFKGNLIPKQSAKPMPYLNIQKNQNIFEN